MLLQPRPFGVLSILHGSTYDITQQMRIWLHYLWPRASNVYAEPKRWA